MRNVIDNHKASSIKELNELVQDRIIEGEEYPRFSIHFRGLPDKNYSLQTRIASQFKDQDTINSKSSEIMDFFWEKVTALNLETEFYIPQSNNFGEYDTLYYKIFQAQHIGVPTLLMDWTFDWRIALYFAVDNTVLKDKSGTLWILLRQEPQVDDEVFKVLPALVDKAYLVNPAFDIDDPHQTYVGEDRRYRQRGQFLIMPKEDCFTPLEENATFRWKLINIEILPALKSEIFKLRESDVDDGLINLMRELRINFSEYDNSAMYGTMSEKLKEAVNMTRAKFGFQQL